MSFFKKSSSEGEPFVPTPSQEVPGIQPIVVQAIENLFPSIDDQKYVFSYALKLGERWRTYQQPKWFLALLYYSKGKIENLIDLNSPLLTDGRFMVDEFEPIFANMKDAEEWVKLITNWRMGNLSNEIKSDNSWILQDALKNINKHFGFMLERGYEVYSAKDYPDTNKPISEVILRKQDLFVRIYAERGVVEKLSFGTNTQTPDEFSDIRTVVYAVTGGKKVPDFFGGTKGHANLLQKHLDKIEAHFGDYVKNTGRIQAAEKEYYKAISPKEAKIIPILHYPLMAIVIILLAGALTTLYMVLLSELFSASSIQGGIGIVSLLLAIGTILVLRRLIK